MSATEPVRTAGRRTKWAFRAAFVVANVALVAVFVQQSLTSFTPSSSGPTSTTSHGALGTDDGYVPDGTTVFDDEIPAVANLDAGLLTALRAAAKDAKGNGVEFVVNSGWRSRAYQEQLLDQAISKYGSRAEAARWVATPDTSPHVAGQAIDIGKAAAAWLAKHGARYGLCQIYDNEPWHYELRPRAIEHGCPPRYADPTHDPRMQQ
ncbi:M15 family metallopeptidase [Kribbella sp. NPDC026611]|uniref:M15 family metallopeptidase n=1 Tax=Kribbella sp. NPDC026611 TaxID=3154911 RepID=UPI0033EF4D10